MAKTTEMILRKAASVVIIVTAALVALPFLLTLAGDAQVHLAIAENFTRGLPFRYNPGGEIVVASTSPFWTILLVSSYLASGSWTPVVLKIIVLLIWLAAAYLLFRSTHDLWHFSFWLNLAALGLWLTHTVVVANALSGLENILSAMQLLLLYVLTAVFGTTLTLRQSTLLGLLFGWMILTRPDGAFLAGVLLANYVLTIILPARQRLPGESAAFKKWLLLLATFFLAAILVLLPWYLYQWSVTGKLITDSSLARLYSGRQGSIPIGPLFFHPKATISLATAFLPLAAGTILYSFTWLLRLIKSGTRKIFWVEYYSQSSAVLLLAAGYLFYSFVVGAESFGRYFLALYPYLILCGIAGLALVYNWLWKRWRWLAYAFVVASILFMITVSGYDYYRRLGPGRFNPEHVLDVIYGPAHLHYYSANLFDLVNAPTQRNANTDEFVAALGLGREPVSIAVTEVQLRYFLDDRVDVLSLDGRTSGDTLSYFNVETGVPDFASYFLATQPDYVHVNQWCTVGGWLAAFRPAVMEENLVCQWQQQTAAMAVGEQFNWQGYQVTLVAPEIVHIDWSP